MRRRPRVFLLPPSDTTPAGRRRRRVGGHAVPLACAVAWGAALAAPRVAAAQAVRVTAVSAATGADVPNALLTAVDARDTTVAVTTTAPRGARLVPVPQAGAYRFVVRRIGQRPYTSAPVVVGARDTLALTLRLPTAPVVLSAVRVTGLASCAAGRRREAPGVTALWDQIRTAVRLVALQDVQAGDSAPPAEVRRFVTRLGPDGRTVLAHTVLPTEDGRVRLFGTVPPESLATRGYVRRTDTTTTYTVPDGPTLLSDAFARDHCFDVVAGADSAPGLVGLAFTPRPGRRVPEVAGVLWADTATAALRALAFRYVDDTATAALRALAFRYVDGGAPPAAPRAAGSGGEVRFDTLPDGTWALVAWRLRTPSVEIGAVTTAGPESGPGAEPGLVRGAAGRAAVGGLAGDPPGVDPPWRVDTRAGLARLAPRVRDGAVTVRVRDARGRPVAGATVALAQQADPAGAAWVVDDGSTRVQLAHAAAGTRATTTADGVASVPALPPGRYLVRVAPRLPAAESPADEVEPPVAAVTVTPDARATLTVDAPALTALAARCPARARADTGADTRATRLIYGTVVDERAWAAWAPQAGRDGAGQATPGADTAAPPAGGARVRATWTDGATGRATTSAPATTDGAGQFVICGIPRTAAAVVTAEAGDGPSASWALALSPGRWAAASTRVAVRRPAARGRRDVPTDPFTLVADGAVHDSVTGALGAVYGVAYDSLARGPLAGAVVQLVRAGDLLGGRAVAADATGAFRIDALAPGRYLVGFSHPLLDLLRIEVRPRLVALGPGGDVVRLDLGLPALARVRPAVCGSPQAPADSTGVVVGRVRDAADGAPVAHATVVLTWSELSLGAGGLRTEPHRVPATTGPDGGYVLCGVPAGVDLAASAAAPGRAGGPVALELPPRGFVLRDLALGDTALGAAAVVADGRAARPRAARPKAGDPAAPVARGTARLTGTVRDPAGRPVRGARAVVWGTAAAATVGADGAFVLGGLPAGTRTLEVRAIGFAMRRVAVDLVAGRAGAVDVRMDRVAALAPVTVFGTPAPTSPRLADFLDRRRRNVFGRFVTAEDIARRQPVLVSDALRTVPGLQVVPDGRFGSTILGRGGGYGSCRATVVVDGVVLQGDDSIDRFVSPQEVGGLEVYPDAAFAPPEYSGARTNGCSVVLVWTR